MAFASSETENPPVARRPGGSRFENAPDNYHVFAAANAGEDAGVEVLTLNLAVDGGDIVYIADTGNNKVKEMDSSGTIINNASILLPLQHRLPLIALASRTPPTSMAAPIISASTTPGGHKPRMATHTPPAHARRALPAHSRPWA